MTTTGDLVAMFSFGAVLLAPGVACLAKPRELANANDTRGPEWVRNWNGRAYPGRTKPWAMVLLGLCLAGVGIFCWVIGILGAAGAINITR